MMRINTTAMAMTSRTWMKPPIVYELTTPSSQSTISTTKIVQSIGPPPFPLRGSNRRATPIARWGGGWGKRGASGRGGRTGSSKNFRVGSPGSEHLVALAELELVGGLVQLVARDEPPAGEQLLEGGKPRLVVDEGAGA